MKTTIARTDIEVMLRIHLVVVLACTTAVTTTTQTATPQPILKYDFQAKTN
jgi:hypothetical protein